MVLIGVTFRDRKEIHTASVSSRLGTPSVGDFVVVKQPDGLRLAGVVMMDFPGQPIARVIRVATEEDMERQRELKEDEEKALSFFKERVIRKELAVKVVDVEFFLTRTKMVVYYTSEGWQDFRDIVKEISREFKMKVEVKGIGVKDAAKMCGGIGICGRVACCMLFLRSFESISLEMAREQNLPSDPSRLTGLCGRLRCCLAYELPIYQEFLKELPKIGTEVEMGQIMGYDIFKREAIVLTEEGFVRVPIELLR